MKDDFQIVDLDDMDFEDQIISDTEDAILEEEEYTEEIYEVLPDEGDTELYYEDENYSDEYAEEYYADEEYSEEYEDAYYEDEEFSEDEYSEEYYAEEYEDENAIEYEMYEEEQLAYENLEEEIINQRPKRKPQGFGGKIKAFFAGRHAMDYVLAATGLVVVTVGIVTAIALGGSKSMEEQVEAMAVVGETLGNVQVVEQSNLLAVRDAYVAMINAVPSEEEENAGNVQVTVNFSSMEKDLKIKFLNKETGELVTGVGFQVELTDSKDKTTTLTDDNKDGIIYETGMKSGSYEVICLSVGGFNFPKTATTVKVKDKVEYQKIDIADEVKKESQVNTAVEDTKKAEKPEESRLADTVEWVESTKTPISGENNFVKTEKGRIPDPSTLGRTVGSFMKMAGFSGTISGAPSGSVDIGASGALSVSWQNETAVSLSGTATWVSDNTDIVSVDNNGNYKANKAGTAVITANISGTKTTDSDGNALDVPETVEGTASCIITVKEAPVTDEVKSISLTGAPASLMQGESATFTATVETTGNASQKILWSCSAGASLSATSSNSGESVTVTVDSKAAVDSSVTVTAKSEENTSVSDAKTFKVTAAPNKNYIKNVSINPNTLNLASGTSKKLEAVVTKEGNVDSAVTWSMNSSNNSYLTLGSDGTVKALPAGVGKTVKVTATTKGFGIDGKTPLKAECSVTITKGDIKIVLNKTKLTMAQGKEETITATVTGLADTKVTWTSDNSSIATVDANGKVKAIAVGTVNITATTAGKETSAVCKLTVVKNAQLDKKTKLKDKDGNQIYIKVDGKFVEATYADYYTATEFFLKGQEQYRYTGWQTLDNKTYFFTKNGDKVTGEQVIQGVKYNFASDGALSMSNGTLGIDVSRYNGNINWQAVKNSGVSYVIIRTGYRGYSSGVLVEDSKFKSNIQGATAAGLKVGVYFVTQAVNEVEAVQEASMVLEQIKPYRISYPVFIDIERSGGRGDNIDRNTRTAVANAFCQTIKNSGYSAGIYANKDWFDNKMNAGQLSAHKIWLAQYATAPTYKGRYDLWQYTSKGAIGGISGHVDLNTSYLGY